jgi:hypothetical protein
MGRTFHVVVGAVVVALALVGFGLMAGTAQTSKPPDKNQGVTTLTLGL